MNPCDRAAAIDVGPDYQVVVVIDAQQTKVVDWGVKSRETQRDEGG